MEIIVSLTFTIMKHRFVKTIFALLLVVLAIPVSAQGLYPYEENGLVGFTDENGNIVIPAQFLAVEEFSEGFAPVLLNYKWGYIDPTGKVVIAPQFEEAWRFGEGRAVVNVDGKYGYIDTTGKFVVPAILEVVFH